MRCLALAEAWSDGGGEVHWLATQLLPHARARLEAEGIRIATQAVAASEEEDASRTVDAASRVGAQWVVLDGYAFGALHQAKLGKCGHRVLFVDDNGDAARYTADIVLNQNAHAERRMYAGREGGSLFLLGPRHALLRREFRGALPRSDGTPAEATNLLVMLGGAGNVRLANLVVDALRSLRSRSRFSVRLALGSDAPAGDVELRGTADWLTASPYIEDMPAALGWADLAVSAAGSTAYELMRMGVPSIVVVVAQNQHASARALDEMGAAVSLGGVEALSSETIEHSVESLVWDRARRAKMAERGRALVDGRGALRVTRAMKSGSLRLRAAGREDLRLTWEWANDSETRAVSFSTAPIPWESHVQWFETRLAHASHRIFIAENGEGKPVGTVRFELAPDHAVVSVSIDPAQRGEGFGRWLIHLGSREIFRERDVKAVHAFIKPGNAASVRAFEGAGFQLHSSTTVREQPALLYTLARCGD